MKLIVITPEALAPREPAVLAALFAAGLERAHLRKPTASRDELAAYLRALPAEFLPRIVLHQHHDLTTEFPLGGRHWRDDSLAPRVPPSGHGLTSRTCHDLATLRASLGHYNSVFLSPVFSSISKSDYTPPAKLSAEKIATLLAARSDEDRSTTVIALGGVTAEKLPRCREIGFDGVAVLGTLWQHANPVRTFMELQFLLARHAA